MKKLIVSAAIAALSFATHAFMLPKVGTGTQPGVWTSNAAGVFKEARTTGYPVFVAVINDSNAGEGCTHCKAFLEKNVSDIEALSKTMPFYMVLLNYWEGAEGYSTSASNYRHDFGTYPILPSVYVSGPDGRISKGWGYPKIERSMINDIRTELMKFVLPECQLSLSGAGLVPYGATWTGTIARSGASTAFGSVSITLSDPRYTVDPAVISWDGSAGSKMFTVKGPSGGDLMSDTVMVTLSTSGFDASKVVFAPQQVAVCFRDARMGQTLEEFKASGVGYDGLSASGKWYVPADGSAALLSDKIEAAGTSSLTWVMSLPGTVSLAAKNPASGGVMKLNGAPLPTELTTYEVEVGDTLTIVAETTEALNVGDIGLKTISFQVRKPAFPSNLPTAITAYKNVPIEISFRAESPSSVTYSASGLPKGLSIDKRSGLISGVAKKAGTSVVTVSAANEYGVSTVAVTFAVASKLPSTSAGNFSGILFDESQQMVGSASWKVAKNGKVKATLVLGGKKTKISGEAKADAAGRLHFSEDGLVLEQADVWTGTWRSLNLYGCLDAKKKGAAWEGSWNAGLTRTPTGYAIVKVKASGAFSLTGKVSAKQKLSAKGSLLVLGRDFVATHLPEWAGDSDAVAFAYGWKKSSGLVFDGGFALYGNGMGLGEFQFGGVSYETVYASRWNPAQPLASLAGADFTGAGWSLFKVAVNGKDKVSAAENDFSGKLSVTKKTGVFKGSFKAEGEKAKYEGVLFVRDGILMGIGGGRLDKTPIAVGIGIAD